MSGFPATIETNLTAASRAGLTLDADASAGTEGAWEELIASTALQSEWGMIAARTIGASGVDTGALIDLGIGAAASEVVILPNINMGEAEGVPTPSSQGKVSPFPQRIAASSRVAVRMEAAVNSETAEVAIWLFQNVHHVENVGTGVTYGADEDAGDACGTSVTPGSGAFGTWTEIGTTSADHNVWVVGMDLLGNTAVSNLDVLVQIGHGPNSGAVTTIGGSIRFRVNSVESIVGPVPDVPMFTTVSSGTKIWARIASGNTTALGVLIQGANGTEVSSGSGGNANVLRGSVVS
jgi:hypothetical protein